MIMQHMFQQSLVLLQFINRVVDIPAACRSWVRTVHTVQQTVDFHRYNFWLVVDAPVVVSVTGALVGRAENCGVSAVAVVLGVVQFLGQGRCARKCNDWECAMLGSISWILAPFYQGGFVEEFVRFST